jgi:hypothetical protein
MSRIVNRPITVTLVHDPDWGMRPSEFVDRGTRYRVVKVVDRWTEVGEWWQQADQFARETVMWRVLDHRHGLFELAQQGQKWMLFRVED